MIKKVLIFAGTIEGRLMAEYLARHGVETYASVATSYGGTLFGHYDMLHVSTGRMNEEQMSAFVLEVEPEMILDATHPYATEVTENIRKTCEKTKRPYMRLIREGGRSSNAAYVSSVEEAVQFLEGTKGNVLVTTGSKELAAFTKLTDYKERVFARVLSIPDVVANCSKLGFEGRHLICMQGPFSYEMNRAMLSQVDAKYMVTKESGKSGGFQEKYDATVVSGTRLVIIGRPSQESGSTLSQCKRYFKERLGIGGKPKITIIGAGMGTEATMTIEGKKVCQQADLIIGAKRVLEGINISGKDFFISYDPEEIRTFIDRNPEYEDIAIVVSGDSGFYSGARQLMDYLGKDVRLISGISSLSYFAARLKIPYEDVKVTSLHGKEANIVGLLKQYPKIFALLGKGNDVSDICKKLIEFDMGKVMVHVGEHLSYPDEKVISGSPRRFVDYESQNLTVILLENVKFRKPDVTYGIRDDRFIRSEVPMTKSEIRSISLSKLQLKEDSIVYDIGAGTGSVSVEMAKLVPEGKVYAIERNEEAAALIKRNTKKFAVDNIELIEDTAEQVIKELPVPTHCFIGGSGGGLGVMLSQLLEMNPSMRIVINAISLDTMSEALEWYKKTKKKQPVPFEVVQVNVARARAVGDYHLMMGQNPIYIISIGGGL